MSSENIQKKDCGPERSFLDNQSHSVTLNDLAMKAGKSYCNFKFQQRNHTITDINQKIVQINASFGRILLYDLLIACRKMIDMFSVFLLRQTLSN